MKHLYTCYLSYPPSVDRIIKKAYNEATSIYEDRRDFDFTPMIPLWKVEMNESAEESIANNLYSLKIIGDTLTISGYMSREKSGYIFIVFDQKSNQQLESLSQAAERAMTNHESAVSAMPYGFEPHTSLIKTNPKKIDKIINTLKTDISGITFHPDKMILSKRVNQNTFSNLIEKTVPPKIL